MTLKQNIFDSYSEKNVFNHLNSQWNSRFNVYPQLPFTKIFDIKSLNVTRKENDFLLKTNIDYTICDKNDKPIMCIEFDGLSQGYNKGDKYVQISPDPIRKLKLQLKLRIALEHSFPFFILSFKEKEYLSKNIHLTILDGIIGQTIARMELEQALREGLDKDQNSMIPRPSLSITEQVQEFISTLEVVLELNWDPIANMLSQIESVLFSRNITYRMSYIPLSRPELPEVKDIFDIEGWENMVKAFNEVQEFGYKVICETHKGKAEGIAWVRNIESSWTSPLIIAKNIAELLAIYKAANMNGIIT